MGVTHSTAVQIAAEFDPERIERAIAYTQDKQQENGVKNAAAFVVTAIKKDYNDALAEEKRKKAEALRLQREKDKLKKQWQATQKCYNDWKTEAIEAAVQAMPNETLEAFQQQFKKSGYFEALRDIFRRNKGAQERHFLIFMRDQVKLDTLEQWAEKNGVDLAGFTDEVRGE